MNYIEAIEILNKYHPDQGCSALLEKPRELNPVRDLDVIIPAYNVEAYINACINSVLKQKTGFSFHVIVINDGSPDRTPELLKKYENNKRVTVIHQENGGLSSARNTGLNASRSRYVMFLDSDDMLHPGAIEKMMLAVKENSADIVNGSYFNFMKLPLPIRAHRQKKGNIEHFADFGSGHCCEKIFDSSLFKNVCFPKGYWFEDSVLPHLLFPLANKSYGISDMVYQRRINRDSITHKSIGNVKAIDSVWVTLSLLADRKKLGLPFDRDYYDYIVFMKKLTKTRVDELTDDIKEAVDTVFDFILREEFPDFTRKQDE